MFMLMDIVGNALIPKDHIKLNHITEGVMNHEIPVFTYYLFIVSNKKTKSLIYKPNICEDLKYYTNYLPNFLGMILEIIYMTYSFKRNKHLLFSLRINKLHICYKCAFELTFCSLFFFLG